jgi:hypothetical protein
MRAIRKLVPAVVATAAVAGVLAVGGYGGSSPESAAPLSRLLTRDMHVDFTPLASPRDAVAKADLVVRGRLAAITDGVTAVYADPLLTQRAAGSYLTFVVDVAEVLSGDAGRVSEGRVYLRVRRSPAVTLEAVRALNTNPEVLLVLADVTSDVPHPSARYVRPASVPDGASLFAAYTDGVWLQDDGDAVMHGLGAHLDELSPAWQGVTTIAAFADAIRAAR